jgi:glucose-fructose oxidoreductase
MFRFAPACVQRMQPAPGDSRRVCLHRRHWQTLPYPMKTNGRLEFTRRNFVRGAALGAVALALGPRSRAASAAPPKKLGIALCGLGRYSTGQLGPALKVTKNCELRGVITGDREKGRQWAQEFGFPERSVCGYDTMAQLADNRDIDIVYVVTPNAIHAGNCLAVVQAGKHLICEKPFTTSVADAERVLAACRAAKLKHSIGYRLHFDPYHRDMMRLAREKDFGPFQKMTGDRGFVMQTRVWRAQKALAGGGPIMDLGVYIIQGACMAAGGPSADADGTPLPGRLISPVAVTAHPGPITRPEIFQDVEEKMFFTLEFADGSVCEAVTSYSHSSDKFRAEGQGWIQFKEHAFTYRGMVVDTSRGPLQHEPPVNQQALQMDDFAACVRDGRESRVSGEMGLRDMKIIEAIYESAKTGRRTLVKA